MNGKDQRVETLGHLAVVLTSIIALAAFGYDGLGRYRAVMVAFMAISAIRLVQILATNLRK